MYLVGYGWTGTPAFAVPVGAGKPPVFFTIEFNRSRPVREAFLVACVLFLLVITFLPWIVAMSRNHKNATPILVLSLLVGWSVIGFAVCLVWALMADQEASGRRRYKRKPVPAEDYGLVDF